MGLNSYFRDCSCIKAYYDIEFKRKFQFSKFNIYSYINIDIHMYVNLTCTVYNFNFMNLFFFFIYIEILYRNYLNGKLINHDSRYWFSNLVYRMPLFNIKKKSNFVCKVCSHRTSLKIN